MKHLSSAIMVHKSPRWLFALAHRYPLFLGWVSVLLTLTIWASFSLISRYNTLTLFTAWDLTAIRLSSGLLLALPVLALQRQLHLLFSKTMFKLALSGGLAYVSFVFIGFSLAPTAHSAIWLYGALPLWTVVLSRILWRQSPNVHEKLSIACLVMGIVVLLWLNHLNHSPFNWGDLSFLVAAVSWAYFTLLLRTQAALSIPLIAGGVGFFSSVIFLPVYILFSPSNVLHVAWQDLLLECFFHGFIVQFVALYTYRKSLEYLGANKTTTVLAMVPFVAALLAVPLLSEPIGFDTVVGLLAAGCAVFQPWRLFWRNTNKPI